jgi:hypothetical protein
MDGREHGARPRVHDPTSMRAAYEAPGVREAMARRSGDQDA